MTTCSTAASSRARSSMSASSTSSKPPVLTVTVVTCSPRSTSTASPYDVSSPPEKASTKLRPGIVCGYLQDRDPIVDQAGGQDEESARARVDPPLQLPLG